ncbi:MAG: NitT/TauT family transport system permease protein [Verrucomicrobiales bacterium]|jgi:NitT/TauT family transport system permease protein
MPPRSKEPWFAVGRPLSNRRSRLLLACSFLLPLALWALIVYLPIWKSELSITLTSDADSIDFPSVYVTGDQMESSRFAAFRQAVRDDNAKATDVPNSEGASTRRANKRILRGLYPLALKEGWVAEGQEKDYAAFYDIWRKIAAGEIRGALGKENLEIIEKNWTSLASVSETYDSSNFYSQPLQKLIPQGERKVKRPVYLPAPHEVFLRAKEDFSGNSKLGDLDIWSRYGVSLRTIIAGFFLVCLVGIPVALLCGTFPFFSHLIEPFVDFFRYMPAPAFGTVLIALFGIYDSPKVALVFVGTLPQLILMVANTTRTLDPALLDAAQTLGADRKRLVTKVVIPGILPSLYNDLRILLGWAWTWLVIAELLGVKAGLTELIDTQGRRFQFDHVYPIILLIGLTGFLTDQFLSWFRGVIFPYSEDGARPSARAVNRAITRIRRPGFGRKTPAIAAGTAP